MARRALMSVLALCSTLFLGCGINVLGFQGIKGSGNVKEETREVPDFSGVAIGNGFQATITIGPKAPIRISADDNLLPLIKTEVQKGRLVVRLDPGVSVSSPNKIKLTITTPQLDSVDASGGSAVKASAVSSKTFGVDASGGSAVNVSGLSSDKVTVEASGGSTIDLLGLSCDMVSVDGGGGSVLKLAGQVKRLQLEMSGGTVVKTAELAAETVQVDGSGGSQADVNASQSVQGDLSGGTALRVLGNPAKRSVETTGGSAVSYK